MKKSNTSPLISWLIVLLLPLYSLPWTIMRMIRLEKTAYVQFAFFMGLVGMLFPPSGDLYRYYLDYTTYKGLDWNSFLVYSLLEFDYLLSFLLYGLASNGLPCDLSRFLFNFVGFFLLGKLFVQLIEDNYDIYKYKSSFLIIFFVLSLNVYLYRSGIASILFIYGAYHVIYKNSKKHWAFVFFSVLAHFSYIFFAIILMLSVSFPLIFRRRWMYVVLIIFFIFGMFNVGVLFEIEGFSGAFFERYKGYMDKEDAGQFAEQFSWKANLWARFGYFISLVLLLFFVKFRKFSNLREWSLVDYLLLLCIISSPFSVVFGRFVAPLTIFLKVYFFENYKTGVVGKKFLKILVCMIIVLDIMNLWAKRHEIAVSDMSLLATSTSISILNHSYTDSWINRNINSYGDLEKYSIY